MKMFRNGMIMIKQENNNVKIYTEQSEYGNWKLGETRSFRTQRESIEYFNNLVEKNKDANCEVNESEDSE
jgi:hypothetical protein